MTRKTLLLTISISILLLGAWDAPLGMLADRNPTRVYPSKPASNPRKNGTLEREAFTQASDLNPQKPQPQLPLPISPEAVIINEAGGPDAFGYTWDDQVPYAWDPAPTDSGLSGDDMSALVPIGFEFPFYENSYSQVNIDTNGGLFFGDYHAVIYDDLSIPSTSPPNDLILPFWEDLVVDPGVNDGGIFLGGGGIAPERWFSVEWRGATYYYDETDQPYTFQVVLLENGDMLFYYHTISSTYWSTTIGIEDSRGQDGLAYPYNAFSEVAIRFHRPDPAVRVMVSPTHQGEHTFPGEVKTYELVVTNTGDFGSDTFNLATASTWPLSLFAADGTTPLSDTSSDGIIDTGPLPQGGSTTVVAKVSTPGEAVLGDYNSAVISATSTLDPGVSAAAALQGAVPAPFAQTYRDDSDNILRTYLAQPGGQWVKPASTAQQYIWDMAIAETPGFVQVWRLSSSGVSNLAFSLLDAMGNATTPVVQLTDNGGEIMATDDYDPAVAVAPNGQIGVVWERILQDPLDYSFNFNIWFAILDPEGSLVYGPQNLTNNTSWGPWGMDNPEYVQPVISATGDNHFILSWSTKLLLSSGCTTDCFLGNVHYQVVDTNGGLVKAATQLTDDALEVMYSHDDSNLTPLFGNKALVTWQCDDGSTALTDICYAVIDSAGNLVKAATNASNRPEPDMNPDAVQLLNGTTLLTWHGEVEGLYKIHYATLDGNYDLAAGPFALDNPAVESGDFAPSVAAAGNNAVITWVDWSNYLHLYYALVDSSGAVITPAMIFLTAAPGDDPGIHTNYKGYGNTSYTIWEHRLYLPVVMR